MFANKPSTAVRGLLPLANVKNEFKSWNSNLSLPSLALYCIVSVKLRLAINSHAESLI